MEEVFTSLVTFIYKPPGKTSMRDRFDPKYREWFEESVEKFDWLYCHRDEENNYYFFMIRPARNIHGHKRGVGGRFSIDKDGTISDFEEILNTYMMAEKEIKKLGPAMFSEIVRMKGLPEDHKFLKYVEFPNKDAFYDRNIFEWSYHR